MSFLCIVFHTSSYLYDTHTEQHTRADDTALAYSIVQSSEHTIQYTTLALSLSLSGSLSLALSLSLSVFSPVIPKDSADRTPGIPRGAGPQQRLDNAIASMECGEEERGHTVDPSLTVQLGSGHRDDTAPCASASYPPDPPRVKVVV